VIFHVLAGDLAQNEIIAGELGNHKSGSSFCVGQIGKGEWNGEKGTDLIIFTMRT